MTDLKKILYVDDELRLQKMTQLALEKFGKFEVEACATGMEALQAAPGFQPDRILLDVGLPEMDGPTTLQELRKIEECQDTPVIFVTASVRKSDLEEYRKLGALDVVEKPYDPMDISGRLKALWSDFKDGS